MRPASPIAPAKAGTSGLRPVRPASLIAPIALLIAAGAAAYARPRRAAAPRPSFLDEIEVERVAAGTLDADGHPVRVGYQVPSGSSLTLSPGARAVLKVGRQGAILLRGPAALQIVSRPRPGIALSRGRLLAAFPALRGAFTVRARGLSAIARDADFYVDLSGSEDLYVCECRGPLQLTDDREGGYRRLLNGDPHTGVGYRFPGEGGEARMIEADHALEGHGDRELQALRDIAAD